MTTATKPPALPVLLPTRAKQNRWTIGFRYLLAIPQFIVLYLISIAALIVGVIGWFAALFTGALPTGIAKFLGQWVAYGMRVAAYLYLLTDRYPPFALDDTAYPAQIRFTPGRLNRAAVLFRLVLVVPAQLLTLLLATGWGVCAFVIWVITLFKGTLPVPAHGAGSALVRFQARVNGYLYMLTATYPGQVFGDQPGEAVVAMAQEAPVAPEDVDGDGDAGAGAEAADGEPPEVGAGVGAWPLVLSSGARALLVFFIVAGALVWVAYIAIIASVATDQSAQALASLNDAYAAATQSVAAEATSLSQCSSQSDPLGCVEGGDRRLAQTMSTLSSAVQGITFPGYADQSANGLLQASNDLEHALTSVAGATSVEQYQAQAQGLDLSGLLNKVDSSYRVLADQLVSGH
jgi:uncharacterized protein DUF4389